LVSAADQITLVCKNMVKVFFKMLKVGISTNLSVKPRKYLGFLVVSWDWETGSKYRTGSSQ
jgi:hypothetical protein